MVEAIGDGPIEEDHDGSDGPGPDGSDDGGEKTPSALSAAEESDENGDGDSTDSSSSASSAHSSPPPSSSSCDSSDSSDSSSEASEGSDESGMSGGGRDAQIYCELAGGSYGVIRLKPHDNTLCAHCPWHDDCTSTRTLNEDAVDPFSGRGRPLGYLSCWLFEGWRFADKAKHKAFKPDFSMRFEARGQLMHEANYLELASKERSTYPPEGDEPIVFQPGERGL